MKNIIFVGTMESMEDRIEFLLQYLREIQDTSYGVMGISEHDLMVEQMVLIELYGRG